MVTTEKKSQDAAARTQDAVRDAVGTLGDAGAEVEERLTGAAAATEAGVRAANRSLRERSDVSLGLLGAFSLGLTSGLLLGGAHRLMIVASLIPAALVGGVILERVDRPNRTARNR